MATLVIFLEYSLRNWNYTESSKEITWISQHHHQKKKKLIRDKVEIENAKMRIIKWETVLNNNGKVIFTTIVS